MSNLRWKVITVLAVLVVFGAIGVYPIVASAYGIHSPSWLIEKQLKLGLDLKGGVHLVLLRPARIGLGSRDEAGVAFRLSRADHAARHAAVMN